MCGSADEESFGYITQEEDDANPFLPERKVEDEWSDVSVNEELETLGDRELNDLQFKPFS